MGMLRKTSTYTVLIRYAATSEKDWEELRAKLAKIVGIQAVVLETVEDEEQHPKFEWTSNVG